MGIEKKSNDSVKACIKVAACVCGKDGIVSAAEEREMYSLLLERFPEWDQNMFESALTEFFDSNDQIEDYLALIDNEAYRQFALQLAEISASADGLEIRENIALEKVYLIWGIDQNA